MSTPDDYLGYAGYAGKIRDGTYDLSIAKVPNLSGTWKESSGLVWTVTQAPGSSEFALQAGARQAIGNLARTRDATGCRWVAHAHWCPENIVLRLVFPETGSFSKLALSNGDQFVKTSK